MDKEKEPGILEEFSLLGNWWHPDRPEKLIGGELHFDPKHGIDLTLWGSFRQELGDKNQYPVVLGQTNEGREVTLFQVSGDDFSSDFHPDGIVQESLDVGYFIIGEHITAMGNFHPRELIIRLYDFGDWLGKNLIEVDREQLAQGEAKYTIIHKNQTIQTVDIPALDCSIAFWSGAAAGPFSTYNGKQLKFHTNHHLVLHPKSPQNELGWYIEALQEIQNLFTLLAGGLMPPIELRLRVKVEHGPLVARHREGYLATVRLFYKPQLSKIREPDFRFGFLYRYDDLKDNIEHIFNRYADREGAFKASISQLLLYLSNVSTQVELQFLVLIQGLEAFCKYKRDDIKGHYVDEAKFETLCSDFLTKVETEVGKEFADKVKSALLKENSQSRSFKEQLKYVVNCLPLSLKNLFHETPDRFLGAIVETRNFLTHGRVQSLEKKALHLTDLYIATLRLWLLLTALVSLELKIDEDIIVKAIENSPNYRRLLINEEHKKKTAESVSSRV